jgi:myosin heavy subunit
LIHVNDTENTADSVRIKEVIIQSTSVLEAFGNAETVQNHNSSRFGKYIKLQYTEDNRLVSSFTEAFLLEKSRIVAIRNNERNYHVFYQMIHGMDAQQKQELSLKDVEDFRILTTTATMSTDSTKDKEDFLSLNIAMKDIGCSEADISNIWRILAALLHLGNATFNPPTVQETPVTINCSSATMESISEILGVDTKELIKSLTTHLINTRQGNSIKIKLLSVVESYNNVQGLIKKIYNSIFHWLLEIINQAHNSLPNKNSLKYIGILDIFGFEILEKNSFEQLCINFTNERLQQQFNDMIFATEQEIYKKEGLNWTNITYQDNQIIIDCISKKPSGLLNVLEEHCMMQRSPDDSLLLQAYHQHHGADKVYIKPRFGNELSFTIKHFAGLVTYSIEGFISKNYDTLQDDITELMMDSENDFLVRALKASDSLINDQEENVAPGSALKRLQSRRDKSTKALASLVTVTASVRTQIDALMLAIRTTEPHYIKCIKPNNFKAPDVFHPISALKQIRYSNIIEFVRIRRARFPIQMKYHEFYARYETLIHSTSKTANRPGSESSEEAKEYCRLITAKYLPEDGYQFGLTLLFLKEYALTVMQRSVENYVTHHARSMQRGFKRFMVFRKLSRLHEEAKAQKDQERLEQEEQERLVREAEEHALELARIAKEEEDARLEEIAARLREEAEEAALAEERAIAEATAAEEARLAAEAEALALAEVEAARAAEEEAARVAAEAEALALAEAEAARAAAEAKAAEEEAARVAAEAAALAEADARAAEEEAARLAAEAEARALAEAEAVALAEAEARAAAEAEAAALAEAEAARAEAALAEAQAAAEAEEAARAAAALAAAEAAPPENDIAAEVDPPVSDAEVEAQAAAEAAALAEANAVEEAEALAAAEAALAEARAAAEAEAEALVAAAQAEEAARVAVEAEAATLAEAEALALAEAQAAAEAEAARAAEAEAAALAEEEARVAAEVEARALVEAEARAAAEAAAAAAEALAEAEAARAAEEEAARLAAEAEARALAEAEAARAAAEAEAAALAFAEAQARAAAEAAALAEAEARAAAERELELTYVSPSAIEAESEAPVLDEVVESLVAEPTLGDIEEDLKKPAASTFPRPRLTNGYSAKYSSGRFNYNPDDIPEEVRSTSPRRPLDEQAERARKEREDARKQQEVDRLLRQSKRMVSTRSPSAINRAASTYVYENPSNEEFKQDVDQSSSTRSFHPDDTAEVPPGVGMYNSSPGPAARRASLRRQEEEKRLRAEVEKRKHEDALRRAEEHRQRVDKIAAANQEEFERLQRVESIDEVNKNATLSVEDQMLSPATADEGSEKENVNRKDLEQHRRRMEYLSSQATKDSLAEKSTWELYVEPIIQEATVMTSEIATGLEPVGTWFSGLTTWNSNAK